MTTAMASTFNTTTQTTDSFNTATQTTLRQNEHVDDTMGNVELFLESSIFWRVIQLEAGH